MVIFSLHVSEVIFTLKRCHHKEEFILMHIKIMWDYKRRRRFNSRPTASILMKVSVAAGDLHFILHEREKD